MWHFMLYLQAEIMEAELLPEENWLIYHPRKLQVSCIAVKYTDFI
jgi:hypothetical protein